MNLVKQKIKQIRCDKKYYCVINLFRFHTFYFSPFFTQFLHFELKSSTVEFEGGFEILGQGQSIGFRKKIYAKPWMQKNKHIFSRIGLLLHWNWLKMTRIEEKEAERALEMACVLNFISVCCRLEIQLGISMLFESVIMLMLWMFCTCQIFTNHPGNRELSTYKMLTTFTLTLIGNLEIVILANTQLVGIT